MAKGFQADEAINFRRTASSESCESLKRSPQLEGFFGSSRDLRITWLSGHDKKWTTGDDQMQVIYSAIAIGGSESTLAKMGRTLSDSGGTSVCMLPSPSSSGVLLQLSNLPCVLSKVGE